MNAEHRRTLRGRETEIVTKIGEYRSRKIRKLGAKVVDVAIMLDRLSSVHGRKAKDDDDLETARRDAMRVAVHVLDGVILELKSEQIENSHAEPERQRGHSERDPRNLDDLIAKLVDVRGMLDQVGRIHGRSEKDNQHLETANRYAMKAAVHVLEDAVWELNMEHLARLQADPVWQKREAENIRQVIEEYQEQKDAEFHKLNEEAEESIR